MKKSTIALSLTRIMTVAISLAMIGCSERTVAASHKMDDGTILEIIGTPGNEHFLIYSLEVRSPRGKLIHKEGFGDIPYGYAGGFIFDETEKSVIVRRDDTDLGYLTTFHRSSSPDDTTKANKAVQATVVPPVPDLIRYVREE